MKARVIGLPIRCALIKAGLRISFMDEYIASIASLCDGIGGSSVTGDDDLAVRGLEDVADAALIPSSVVNAKSGDSHISVFVYLSGSGLVRLHSVTGLVGRLTASRSNADVLSPRFFEMLRHGSYSRRPIDLQRHVAAQRPRAENEVGQSESVIGMQVSYEDDLQLRRFQRGNLEFLGRSRCAPHDAGAAVDDVRSPVNDDSYRRPGTFRIRHGHPRTQHDDLRLLLREDCARKKKHGQD